MYVYVVIEECENGDISVSAVFSTEEKAKEYINKQTWGYFYIVEKEVDVYI